MANTYIVYPNQTGAVTDYTIPFEYLSRDYVKATVDGAQVPFTFLSTYMIRFLDAPVGNLKIYRDTNAAELINTYTDGSILIDDDLNESYHQSLHVSEEMKESSLRQTSSGLGWNASGFPLENLGDPSKPQDAATNKQITQVNAGITQVNARITQEITDRQWGDTALNTRIDNLLGNVQDIADDASNSAVRAEAGATESELHAQQAHSLVEAATSGFTGFDSDAAYDFGWVNDPMTYFNRDWGTI